jgi:hypothetical protein
MRTAVMAACAAAMVLTGCTRVIEGELSPNLEPLTAEGMTCREFSELSEVDRAEVVREVLEGNTTQRPLVVAGLAFIVCKMAPDASVEQVVRGFSGR